MKKLKLKQSLEENLRKLIAKNLMTSIKTTL